MRLRALQLLAVGPFEGVTLDLSGGQQGLHLIHGPNEAGKTSALRALRCLLFGFPHRADEVGFRVPYDRLRVGAVLERGDGTTLEVVRRKGNKNTLRAGDDTAVIDEAELGRLLGGIDGDSFAQLFGIDHDGLQQAGEQIRSGSGRFGELLFSAAAGLQGLEDVRRNLDERMQKLFKPRGQNQQINQTMSGLHATLQTLKQATLPCEEWAAHDRALAEARQEADRIEAELGSRRAARGRLERVQTALPLVGRYLELHGRVEAMAGVPRLRDEFDTEARTAMEGLAQARRDREVSAEQLEEVERELASLEVPETLLAGADEVEDLRTRLGEFLKARADRPRLVEFQKAREHRVRDLLQELGRPRDLAEAEPLRLRVDEGAAIRVLGHRRGELVARLDDARGAIVRCDQVVARLAQEQEALDEPPDVAMLSQVVRQVRKAGDLEEQGAAAHAESRKRDQAVARALKALRGGPADLEALEGLAVPLDATVDRFEAEFEKADADRDRIADRLEAQRSVVSELEAELRGLDAELEAPSEEGLLASRRERQAGWELVRAAWRGEPAAGDPAEFVATHAPGRDLAEAYERTVARSDELADRLRREADRVARRAQCVGRREQACARHAELERARDAIAVAREDLESRWRGLTEALELAALTPRELRGWLGQRAKILELGEQARQARAGVERLETEIGGHRRRLDASLREAGLAATDPDAPLAVALDAAEERVKQAEAQRRRREKVRDELDRQQAERTQAEERERAAAAELDAWRAEWAPRMSRVGLEPSALPEQAGVFLDRIRDLFDQLKEAHDYESRVRGIDRDAEAFRALVAAVTARLAPEVEVAEDPGAPVEALAARLREARAQAERRRLLEEQRRTLSARIEAAQAVAESAAIRIEGLCREAGCDGAEGLFAVAAQAQERARLEREQGACEAQLNALAGGATVAAFLEEVRRHDPDGLAPQIDALDAEIGRLEAALRDVQQTIGKERNELDRMNGSADAADAADHVQASLAQLRDDVARYARLKLAAAVLRRGVERYRERNQGPVLGRASALFATLTDGSFTALRIDDEDGQAVLKGVRPDGELVGVEGMSDGSHDQLYLALRLASLESWLDTHEPIPLVLDDILLNFDNRRATAALRALAELSRKTQVLFFTHHEHLVDLAEETLRPDVVFVRRLPGRVGA